MVSIGTLFSDFMQLVGLNHYTKTQSDNQYAAKDHSHTGYLTSHQDISGKLDKAQGSSKASKNVVTDSNGNITTEAKPTIPSASSTTPSADTTNGSVGSGTTWAKADHTHPKSTLYAEASHTHSNYVNPTIVDNLTTNDSTKVLSAKQGKVLQDNKLEKTHASYKGKNVVTNASTGAIEFEDKPTIPSKTSDLTNDSGFLTSHQDISGKANSADLATVATSGSYNDLSNKPTIPSVDSSLSSTSTNPVQNKVINTALSGKASSTHSHTKSEITDFPSTMTPSSHTHGNLSNDGKIGSASGKIITTGTNGVLQASNSITKSLISDFPTTMTPSNHTHGTGDVSDSSAYTNIGSNANATQKTINDKINTALGNKANSSNVYSKSETYTQSEITTLISNAVAELQLFEVVESLPTTNIKNNRLYLIVNGETIANNSYDIYLRVNDSWESLDALEFDISNFYNKTEVDTLLNGKVDTSDSRLTDTRTPKSHTHGNITNTGAVGSTANKPLITTTNGVVTTGSFGTSANTFCQGNDSRLSDARTPTSHSHGSLANGGTLNSDITSVNKIAVTDSNNNLKTIGSLPYSKLSGTPTIPSKTSDLTNDSGFLTSHQDISGKIDTAGSGLSKSGTTLNHSNSVTALTTASLKKVKYDAQGHITGTSDVSKSDITALGIPSSDTTYSAEKGITLSSGKFGHSNTAITAQTTSALKKIKYDSYGHITGTDNVNANDLPSHGHTLDDVQLYDPITGNPVFGYDGTGYLYALNDALYINTNEEDIPYLSSSNSPIASLADIPTNNNQLTNGAGYITSSAISGKIDTAGTGLSKSGTTLNHSNSITAVTTAAFKKIKYDAQGHITGTADVSASDLPSHTHNYLSSHQSIGTTSKNTTNGSELAQVTADSVNKGSIYHPKVNTSALTGVPTANQTPTFGGTFSVSQPSVNTDGHITALTSRTITIPSLPTASTSAAGIIQIGTGATNAAAGNHTHSGYASTSDIPTATSDLTNDGEDGTNAFISEGDSRLTNARTPTSHTHGNLTNDGKVGSTADYFVYTTTGGAITSKQKIGNITTSGAIGSTANKPLITTTSGVITTGSFGTAANTFCAGNDSRLHTHTFTYSNGTLTIS